MLLAAATAVAAPLPSYLSFLVQEVPAWDRENRCFSCHNNGDGARVLFFARRLGYAIPAEVLQSTVAWLRNPGQWEVARGVAGSNDKNLARVQFASALAEAWRAGAIRDRGAMRAAADLLVQNQDASGAWPVDAGGLPGAPATWGTPMATRMARQVLAMADARAFAARIARADGWLAAAACGSVPDAAAILMSSSARADCRDLLIAAQSRDGGWGPQRGMPAEPFDTALAVLALRDSVDAERRGRAWLLRMQEASGAWPETTRPGGRISYAERISTAAWVSYALLSTER